MAKILIIEKCGHPCGYYEHEKVSRIHIHNRVTGGTIPIFRGWCMHPNLNSPLCTPTENEIPEWCPLPDANNKETDRQI